MTLADVVKELLGLATTEMPTAATIQAAFAPRAAKVDAGARSGAVYLTLSGDLAGMEIYEDSRGWGAYVELGVTRGALTELQAVVGATTPMPRAPGDFHSGPKVAAYVNTATKPIRVFAELHKDDATRIKHVTMHFQR